jgi:hypothetical protein
MSNDLPINQCLQLPHQQTRSYLARYSVRTQFAEAERRKNLAQHVNDVKMFDSTAEAGT